MSRQRYVTHSLMLLVIVVGANNTTPQRKDQNLVEVLRRQLMNNNYDYMEESGESDRLTTQNPDELPVVVRGHDQDYVDYNGHLDDEISNHVDKEDPKDHRARYLSRRNEPSDDSFQGPRFYEDEDNHLDTRRLIEKHDETMPTSTTVRYRVLEVLDLHSGRRSGLGASRRRFLQEERPDHIAIVPLDDGPIPEFRLPSNRRQYMGDLDRWEIPDIPIGAVMDPLGPTTPSARRNRAPIPANETDNVLPRPNTEERFYGSIEPNPTSDEDDKKRREEEEEDYNDNK